MGSMIRVPRKGVPSRLGFCEGDGFYEEWSGQHYGFRK